MGLILTRFHTLRRRVDEITLIYNILGGLEDLGKTPGFETQKHDIIIGNDAHIYLVQC